MRFFHYLPETGFLFVRERMIDLHALLVEKLRAPHDRNVHILGVSGIDNSVHHTPGNTEPLEQFGEGDSIGVAIQHLEAFLLLRRPLRNGCCPFGS